MLMVGLIFSQLLAAQRPPPPSKIKRAKSQQDAFYKVNDLLKLDQHTNTKASKQTGKSVFFNYNTTVANSMITQPREYLALEIPGTDYALELRLVPQSFSNYSLVLKGEKAERIQPDKQAHYRGVVRGFEMESFVALSLFEEDMIGLISIDNQTPLNLRKLSKNSNLALFEDGHAAPPKTKDAGCQTTAEHQNERLEDIYKNITAQQFNPPPDSSKCLHMYVEVDYEIYSYFGSVAKTNNFVIGLFNQVSTLYYNESILLNISEIVIWTTPDPYSNLIAQGLNDFVAYRPAYNGDLAMLLTYRPYGSTAGIANGIGGLCSNTSGLSAHSHTSLYPDYAIVPNYSGQVKIVTHEIGHVLGSRHTHACVWNGDFTAIDGCAPTEGSCPLPPLPPNGGTIMSYCTSTVGTNLNLGFGVQPGDVIRNIVNTATCLQPCYVTDCDEFLQLNGTINDTKYYEASDFIESEQQLVKDADVEYVAGNKITLKPGFKAKENTTFLARIGACQPAYPNSDRSVDLSQPVTRTNPFKQFKSDSGLQLTCMPNPFSDRTTVKYFLDETTSVSFTVYDLSSRLLYTLNKENQEAGNHQFDFFSKEMPSGMYLLKMQTGTKMETTKILITK